MKNTVKKIIGVNANESIRNEWLTKTLKSIPSGLKILDAGAGELKNKSLCSHLEYVSQDLCQYDGKGDLRGLQVGSWDTKKIDIVCDITNIPSPDASFDVILCSEVFEHLPDAVKALEEFSRLIKDGGVIIITAPFASLVHFAPFHYSSGFSRYWYEFHLPKYGFEILELSPNGDWFSFERQELLRLPSMARQYGDWCWPLAYLTAGFGLIYFLLRGKSLAAQDIASLGWHCVAVKSSRHG